MDVDRIFDWVIVHAVAIGALSFIELAIWNGLGTHFALQAGAKPLLLALSMSLAIVAYAPLRTWSLNGLRTLSGRERPSLAESLHKLLERAQVTDDPRASLEQTLQWMLNPGDLTWILPGQGHDALLERLSHVTDGLLGYELGEVCPKEMESAAWIPIQIDQAMSAMVLSPQGARGWNRNDLRIARTLARAGEPLFEMRRMQHNYQRTQAAMREQRDELVREMHDGLGSQLFGASLLANVPENMDSAGLRKRFCDVNDA